MRFYSAVVRCHPEGGSEDREPVLGMDSLGEQMDRCVLRRPALPFLEALYRSDMRYGAVRELPKRPSG